jgi:hypothetical protein
VWLGFVRFEVKTVAGESVTAKQQLVPTYAMRLRKDEG